MTSLFLGAGDLPKWLQAELPIPSIPAKISYHEDTHTYVLEDDDGSSRSFDNFKEAYDANRMSSDLVISDNVPESDDYGFVYVPVYENTNRLLFSHSDETRLQLLIWRYEAFLKAALKYRKDPRNFSKAYNFIIFHPAFWTKRILRDTERNEKTFYWQTSRFNTPFFEVFISSDDSYTWFIESGPHISPEYTQRSHDFRLDVYGRTPEECVFELAEKLEKLFNDDGSEKAELEEETL